MSASQYIRNGGSDVTPGENPHSELAEREEQLRLASEAAEVGLWDVDLLSGTLFWHSRVKAMFGISPDVPVSIEDFYAHELRNPLAPIGMANELLPRTCGDDPSSRAASVHSTGPTVD